MRDENSSTAEKIRDFLYVDNDLLYSLYSQAFQGVAESIIQSFSKESTETDKRKGAPFSGQGLDTKIAEATQRTESRVLYDHMYTRLEEKLGKSIHEPQDLNPENLADELGRVSLIKVKGCANLEDYQYVRSLLERYNDLVDAVFEGWKQGENIDEQRKKFEKALKRIDNPDERARFQLQFDHLADDEELRKRMGLQRRGRELDHVRLVIDLFHPEGLDLTLERDRDDQVSFRSVCDRQWLRRDPEQLRTLHGGTDLGDRWTLMGLVSFVPDQAPDPEKVVGTVEGDGALLRDSFKKVFESADQMSRVLLQSGLEREVSISPVAIYREFDL